MQLIWKEWRQQRLIFGLGCILGVLFPLAEGLSNWKLRGEFRSDMGGGIILGLGALFALIVATATTYDDVRRGVSDFWASRPVSVGRLLTVKLAAGAVLLGVAFLLTGSMGFVGSHGNDYYRGFAWNAITLTWPIAVMIFSAAIFFTVVLRDAARAVLVTIWVGLLVYFVPLLVNGLGWLSVFSRIETNRRNSSVILALAQVLAAAWSPAAATNSARVSRPVPQVGLSDHLWSIIRQPEYVSYLAFTGFCLAAAAASLALSVRAVKRRWRWDPGQKTIVWLLGLSGAAIFGLAMSQVGHNLPPLTTYEGKSIDPVVRFYAPPENTYDWADPKTAGKMVVQPSPHGWVPARLCTHGDLLFKVSVIPETKPDSYKDPVRHNWILDIYQYVLSEGPGYHRSTVRFWSGVPVPGNMMQHIVECFVTNDRLHVVYAPLSPGHETKAAPDRSGREYGMSLRFAVLDIHDPAHPKRISDRELHRPERFGVQRREGTSRHGDYCYIGLAHELLVVSLKKPDAPEIVRRIDKSALGLARDPGKETIPNVQLDVVDNRLLCVGQYGILVLDVSDPERPKTILYRTFSPSEGYNARTEIRAATLAGDFVYVSRYSGIEVYDLEGNLVGQRRATPLEQLSGRLPQQLRVQDGKLFEAAGSFGVLVYSLADPARPKRIHHGGEDQYVSALGWWNGLFYIADTGHAAYTNRFGKLVFLDAERR